MESNWVLVTVRNAYTQYDVQLPADLSVAEVIALLLVALGLVAPPPTPEVAAR